MVKMTATLGLSVLWAVSFRATGLSPGIKYLENRFALLWLALSLLSLIGFGGNFGKRTGWLLFAGSGD